jgi:hypothetical protein
MKRIIRQASTFLALLLIVTLVRLPYGSYRDRLLPRLRHAAKNASIVSLDAEDISVSFPAELAVKKLGLLFAAGMFPVPVLVDSAVFHPALLPLLGLTADIAGKVQLYNGVIDLSARRGFFSSGGSFELHGRGIELEQHPVLQSLAARGTLSVDAKGSAQADPQVLTDIDSLDLKVNLNHGELSSGLRLFGVVQIPPIKEIEGTLDAQLRKTRAVLSDLNLSCSLGTLKGSGAGNIDRFGLLSGGNASFSISLTAEGQSTIGQYLALAANIPLNGTPLPAHWKIQIDFNGTPRPPVRIQAA